MAALGVGGWAYRRLRKSFVLGLLPTNSTGELGTSGRVSNFRCRIVGPSDELHLANSGAGRATVRKLAGGARYE